jgi:hypothetical protein
MTLLLLLAALAIAGAGAWVSRRKQVLGQAMMGLGGLGLIGVVILQVRQNVFPSGPKAPNRYEMAASYGLANCLLGDAAGQSGKVVLLFPQRSVMDADTEQSYEDGFLLSLRHGRGKLDLKAVHLEGANGDLSAFKQGLAQAKDAMAVVSYAGVPAGFETLFAPGKSEGPPFYVLDSDGTTDWLGALKSGRIKAVVLRRPGVDAHSRVGISGMPDSIFERFFIVATPANAAEVAADLDTEARSPH